MAADVRVLLEDVGQLREERRALQFEIAQLMALKSQHGPGGKLFQAMTSRHRAT